MKFDTYVHIIPKKCNVIGLQKCILPERPYYIIAKTFQKQKHPLTDNNLQLKLQGIESQNIA